MLKPKFGSILIYFLIKYIVVYALLMFIYHNYGMIEHIKDIETGADLFLYLWMVLFLPITDVVIFSFPFLFLFRLNNKALLVVCLIIIVILEYLVYVYFTSMEIMSSGGIIIESIGFALFCFLFYRRIICRTSTSSKT